MVGLAVEGREELENLVLLEEAVTTLTNNVRREEIAAYSLGS